MMGKHILSELLMRKADITGTPIDGVFELTPICNMACKMCYIRKEKKEVLRHGGLRSADEWLQLAMEAKKQGLLFLLLTGGEIFTYSEFDRLYIKLVQMGFIVSLNTNGTLVTEKQILLLKQYPPRCVNVTLYGGNQEVYERMCGYGEGFHKALETISLLKENEINVKINVSLTPDNADDFETIYKFASMLSIPVEASAYMFPPVRRGNTSDFIRFSPEQTAQYTYFINQLSKSNEEFALQKEAYRKRSGRKDNAQNDNCMTCRGGHSSFWVTWDGKMTPCGMMEFPYSLPFEDGFLQAWKSVFEQTKQIKLSAKCEKCDSREVCSVCAAKALAETGKIDGTPEYICDVTRAMNDILIRGVKNFTES